MPGKFIEPRVRIPAEIQQGDSPSWIDEPFYDIEGTVYNADGYTLTYYITGPTSPANVVATAQAAGWSSALTAQQTSGFTPGTYWWQAKLTAANITLTIARGELTVLADLATKGAGYDGRSPNEIRLGQIETALAALTGANGAAVKSYRIGEREMTYQDIPALQTEHARLTRVVLNERTTNSIAQGQGNPRKLYARFPGWLGGARP